jgi:hypothetical protein
VRAQGGGEQERVCVWGGGGARACGQRRDVPGVQSPQQHPVGQSCDEALHPLSGCAGNAEHGIRFFRWGLLGALCPACL